MEPHEHPLSWEALSRIVLMGIALLLIWKALGAVVDVVIALALTASLHPLVHTLHNKTKLPMLISALIVLLLIAIPFFIIGFSIIPQIPQLLSSIDATVNQLPFIGQMFNNFSIVQYMESRSGDIVASSGNILLIISSVIATLVLTFYFVYDYERLLKLFLNIFPYKEKAKLKGLLEEIARVTGQFIRGNVIISCISFIVIFIGLLILKIPLAMPLALIAGVFDLLPLVGSTLGAIPALLVAFSLSPVQGFSVLILFIIYQQVENIYICPAIYNKALNLYPALGFLAVLVGASLFGILGAFLALPVAASIPVVVEYHENYKERHQTPSEIP
ncbi:MAG: AI-2E family transporter [Patescibacteria group bacterium]|nr:AI-2E family transporter [Patescibacteria group bacterium]